MLEWDGFTLCETSAIIEHVAVKADEGLLLLFIVHTLILQREGEREMERDGERWRDGERETRTHSHSLTLSPLTLPPPNTHTHALQPRAVVETHTLVPMKQSAPWLAPSSALYGPPSSFVVQMCHTPQRNQNQKQNCFPFLFLFPIATPTSSHSRLCPAFRSSGKPAPSPAL